MSKNEVKITNEDYDDDDIDPSELIDTQENKPKINQQNNLDISEEPAKESQYRRIERKPVSKLTEDENNYLINLYKNGGEDDFYKVYFYKNGTHKIVKKKQPPKYNTAKRLLEQQQQQAKPVMTTEQVLMEHVIDLEAKYATLYQKHKKLKKNYKSLHEDIYMDDDYDKMNVQTVKTETVAPSKEEQEEVIQKESTKQQPTEQYTQEQPTYNEYMNNYMNRFNKTQKGYRKRMMASLY